MKRGEKSPSGAKLRGIFIKKRTININISTKLKPCIKSLLKKGNLNPSSLKEMG
jgi:hypothetical protein